MSSVSSYRTAASLDAECFARVRRAMVLDHCKWDPQVGDTTTLAGFPLVMPHDTWHQLATWAEALTAEADAAERELVERPDLWPRLGLPRRLRSALARRDERDVAAPAPRAYRYDFHFTSDGWRISECNADVPGGYAEGSGFAALMAEHYPELQPAGDPGGAWARAIASSARNNAVGLVSAAGFLEDAQVVQYLAKRLQQLGLRAFCLQPAQVSWRDDLAFSGAAELGALVRFYQAEWLAKLPGARRYLRGARTPVLNPGSCIAREQALPAGVGRAPHALADLAPALTRVRGSA